MSNSQGGVLSPTPCTGSGPTSPARPKGQAVVDQIKLRRGHCLSPWFVCRAAVNRRRGSAAPSLSGFSFGQVLDVSLHHLGFHEVPLAFRVLPVILVLVPR